MYPKGHNRIRAAGIVLCDDALLVMFRRRDGREYYTFPGGGVEEGELPADAVVREIREETMVEVEVGELLYELHREEAPMPREFFYRCIYKSGTPTLGSDSIERAIFDEEKNYFVPKWIKFSDADITLLLPTEVTEQLFRDLKSGFSGTTVVLEGAPIQ